MNMYNEILAEMDKNIELESVTEIYDAKLAEKDAVIAKKDEALTERDEEIARLKAAIALQGNQNNSILMVAMISHNFFNYKAY